MPPMSPANTIASSWSWWTRCAGTAALVAVAGLAAARVLTTAFVTVIATDTDRNAPTRLATAEMATATFGLSAPVAIDVAIALPVSWNPLVKSKPRAVTTTRTRMSVCTTTDPCHRTAPVTGVESTVDPDIHMALRVWRLPISTVLSDLDRTAQVPDIRANQDPSDSWLEVTR